MPPVVRNGLAGEMRSSLSPDADSFMWATGAPTVLGKEIDTLARLGRATGDVVSSGITLPSMMAMHTAKQAGEVGKKLAEWHQAQAAGRTPEQIAKEQEELRARGYYDGAIDGIEGDGTKKARQRFQAEEPKRREQELEAARSKAQQTGNEAAIAKANADLAEAQRRRKAEETAAQQREAGEQRLRDVDKNTPLLSQLIRDYGPPAGYALGAFAGPLAAKGTSAFFNKLADRQATRANRVLDEAAAAPNELGRVGPVNQFWSEGQSRPLRGAPDVPFPTVTGQSVPFTSNPSAPASSTLYQPNRAAYAGADAAVSAGFGAEATIAADKAREANAELAKAREALETNPSEVNIQRYQTAKDLVAIYESAANVGRVGVFTHAPAAIPKYLQTPARPNMSRADTQRLELERYLADQTPAVPPPPPQPPPPPVRTWQDQTRINGKWGPHRP
jgi:hypothetical protein